MVNEISLSGEILHLKDISKPMDKSVEKPAVEDSATAVKQPELDLSTPSTDQAQGSATDTAEIFTDTALPEELRFPGHSQWPTAATAALRAHLSDESIVALHDLLLDGRTPKPKQDAGWGGRTRTTEVPTEEEMSMNAQPAPSQGRQRGRGRGGRGRGGGRPEPWRQEDTREVLTQVIGDKDARGAAHIAIREALKGLFETSARETPEGQRLVIKWASAQPSRPVKPKGPKLPQFIHFTLHKTNRETMDCLGHIGRMLSVPSKDLSVCGTKDKRAVTVQRVCMRRGNYTLETAWKAINGVKSGRRTAEEAVTERGERGTRVGDLAYSTKQLDLGKLKGNHFTITLRNVKDEEVKDIDGAMSSIRDRGFINFYGKADFLLGADDRHAALWDFNGSYSCHWSAFAQAEVVRGSRLCPLSEGGRTSRLHTGTPCLAGRQGFHEGTRDHATPLSGRALDLGALEEG